MSDSLHDAVRPGQLWGGRFTAPSAGALADLSRAPEAYFALLPQDVRGSRAHARELLRAGILTAAEQQAVDGALADVAAEYAAGELAPEPGDEDVHGFVERVLVERLGDVGGKLRAGRSRNDQTANDLRLYLRDVLPELGAAVAELVAALTARATEAADYACPGMTHLQAAQPVTFGHHLLAHAYPVARSLTRLANAYDSCGLSPLGAAALAGNALAVSPRDAATEQGYRGIVPNSIDAVAARDHVLDFLYAAATLATDLSRLSEELIVWANAQFGWIGLPDAYATGSSIMPQKKNPDVPELARGKASRIQAHLAGMFGVLKGLPFSYNRDLGEDKYYVLDTVGQLRLVLPALTGLVTHLRIDRDAMAAQATAGFTLATEVADWLAEQGVPFREAHEVTGALVQRCEADGVGLEDLAAADLAAVDARLTPAVLDRLTVDSALRRRSVPPGTAPSNVAPQVDDLAALTATALHRMGVESHA